MLVYYRLSGKESKHEAERPIYAHDKFKLVEFCLKSFVVAFMEVKPQINFLLDQVPEKWVEMLDRVVPFEMDIIRIENASQGGSYFEQLKMARKTQLDEVVFFAEDDYYYLPNVNGGQKIKEAINNLGFVSPYDHGEFYKMQELHPTGPYEIRLVANHHFRTERYNTMTWGTSVMLLNEYWETLNIHGFLDKLTWDEMRRAGAKLWSPIPTLATHMHNHWLSPGIDWSEYFDVGK